MMKPQLIKQPTQNLNHIQGRTMTEKETAHLLLRHLNVVWERRAALRSVLVLVMTRAAVHTLVFLHMHGQTSV